MYKTAAAESKKPPRRSLALAGTSDVRSLVATDWVAHTQGLSDAFLPSAPLRAMGLSILNVLSSPINADLDSPLGLLNLSLSSLP